MTALMQRSGSATTTHAFSALPLDGLQSSNPPPEAAVERETLSGIPDHPQYRRLFGSIPPHMAITPVASLSPEAGDPRGSPSAVCDPSRPESRLCPDHPSARSLADIAALRLRHLDKGHTPESDARHGPVFFMAAARAWWERAKQARSAEARRKAMVAAAAIFVAMIDAHDFTQQQELAPCDP